MAFKPLLDLEIMANNHRPFLPGNWQLMSGRSWHEFEAGNGEAIRTIRHHGQKYWLTATVLPVYGSAKLAGFGLMGLALGPTSYRHFDLHQVDPRSDEYDVKRHSVNLGSLTTIRKGVAKSGWSN